MDIKVEKSLSNRAVCKNCINIIPLNTLRVVIEDRSGLYLAKRFLCQKCGKEYIKVIVNKLRESLKKLK